MMLHHSCMTSGAVVDDSLWYWMVDPEEIVGARLTGSSAISFVAGWVPFVVVSTTTRVSVIQPHGYVFRKTSPHKLENNNASCSS